MAKLSELLLVEAIRRYAETLPAEATGWLAGLKDPFLARALAQLVGYESEASFTRAFKRELGVPPAQWRRQA